ncbi:type 2 DNA topoisomerase 6 subunit B-like isoform X2 [Typha latifolia]|uniref:type 2 DNA topoisomerase 6 subunit B-like isoform X2 n=1 Tax=Typha latifolia TaxID=4733 RepID=UPI003C30811A
MEYSCLRKVFQTLIYWSIQRCRISGSLCRLSVSVKRIRDSNPPLMQISISDTGVGSSLVEFEELDTALIPLSNAKWDGMLLITTTGVHDKDICHYQLNIREAVSSRTRFTRLPPTYKTCGIFSGTEVCFSTPEEENIDDFMVWVVGFFHKILVLKDPDIVVELSVEQIGNLKSKNDLSQEINDIHLPLMLSSVDHLASGLKEYALKHGNSPDKECQTCYESREHLKVGKGVASNTGNMNTGKIVEAVIVIAAVASHPCCWMANCSTAQVLHFQDFTPCTMSLSSLNALSSINWQNYGLSLKEKHVDADGNIVLEWEMMTLFARMDIAIHCYHRSAKYTRQRSTPDRNLVKKAVKVALDDLKANNIGLFLSSHSIKIRENAPELSRAIAGLILSSNDSEFQDECAALLGLPSVNSGTEGLIESCIHEKIVGIIELNDKKPKEDRNSAPCLFECENLYEEDAPFEEGEGAEEDNMLDF